MIRTFVCGADGIRRQKNMGEGPRYAEPLNLDTLPTWLSLIEKLDAEESVNSGDSALLLGSGMWDMARGTDENMDNHLEAVEKYIRGIRIMAPLADILEINDSNTY